MDVFHQGIGTDQLEQASGWPDDGAVITDAKDHGRIGLRLADCGYLESDRFPISSYCSGGDNRAPTAARPRLTRRP